MIDLIKKILKIYLEIQSNGNTSESCKVSSIHTWEEFLNLDFYCSVFSPFCSS